MKSKKTPFLVAMFCLVKNKLKIANVEGAVFKQNL